MKKFFSDFKAFITKGNIIDLAIAVVIGSAFGAIVTSMVNDLIMPLISLIVGGADVSDWKWVIREADAGAGIAETALRYGNFIQTIINFLIIAFFIFLVLRLLMNLQNNFKKVQEGFVVMNRKEKKEFMKDCKAKGMNKIEAVAALEKHEQELSAKKKADEVAKAAAEAANKPQTTEELLIQIRDLLQKEETKDAK